MATSTERTIRDLIVDTIKSISNSVGGLGFDETGGNIHDYLVDQEVTSKRSNYLTATCDGKRVTRAWGVSVVAKETPYATGNRFFRDYTITVQGYYPAGGEGLNLLVDHARLIRGALRQLTPSLNGQVDRFDEITELQTEIVQSNIDNSAGEITQGTFEILCGTLSPSW